MSWTGRGALCASVRLQPWSKPSTANHRWTPCPVPSQVFCSSCNAQFIILYTLVVGDGRCPSPFAMPRHWSKRSTANHRWTPAICHRMYSLQFCQGSTPHLKRLAFADVEHPQNHLQMVQGIDPRVSRVKSRVHLPRAWLKDECFVGEGAGFQIWPFWLSMHRLQVRKSFNKNTNVSRFFLLCRYGHQLQRRRFRL